MSDQKLVKLKRECKSLAELILSIPKEMLTWKIVYAWYSADRMTLELEVPDEQPAEAK
jgi:hypothetical protein